MRKLLVVVLAVSLVSCGPQKDRVLLDFTTPEKVTVTASIDMPQVDDARERGRIASLREAVFAGRDPWSVRIASLGAQSERVVFDRSRGALVHADHSATLAHDELERLFADVNATVRLTHGDGFTELTIVPGMSDRATREQRTRFDRELQSFGRDAAQYFLAVDRLYSYLNGDPERAHYVFAAMFADDDEPVALKDEEQTLVRDVRRAIETLTPRFAVVDDDSAQLAGLVDVVTNPFPADINVKLRSEPTLVEGFTKDGDIYAASVPTLPTALASLEGRWISPDPLALAFRAGDKSQNAVIDELAHAERRSTSVVNPTEITAALVANLKPPAVYRVRWVE